MVRPSTLKMPTRCILDKVGRKWHLQGCSAPLKEKAKVLSLVFGLELAL